MIISDQYFCICPTSITCIYSPILSYPVLPSRTHRKISFHTLKNPQTVKKPLAQNPLCSTSHRSTCNGLCLCLRDLVTDSTQSSPATFCNLEHCFNASDGLCAFTLSLSACYEVLEKLQPPIVHFSPHGRRHRGDGGDVSPWFKILGGCPPRNYYF